MQRMLATQLRNTPWLEGFPVATVAGKTTSVSVNKALLVGAHADRQLDLFGIPAPAAVIVASLPTIRATFSTWPQSQAHTQGGAVQHLAAVTGAHAGGGRFSTWPQSQVLCLASADEMATVDF
eukprot:6213390-Pleurochrysis_carterae.AAC.1